MTIQEIVADIFKKKEAVGGVDSVYLVACGGSFAGFYPVKYLLDHASRTLRCAMFTANEFVHALPDACRPNSIVLGCSMRGTPETGEAVRAAREHGAATVAFYVQESKMTGYSEYKVQYETIAEDVSARSRPMQRWSCSFALNCCTRKKAALCMSLQWPVLRFWTIFTGLRPNIAGHGQRHLPPDAKTSR